jgi:anti-sigma regulatory factor (Ser/Thr protein kinase)
VPEADPPHRIQIELPRTPEAGALARRAISRHFAPSLAGQSLQQAKLVAAELVNNAYQHGRGQIRLEVLRIADRLRIEVVDEGRGRSIAINRHPTDRSGRGLTIVDAVATEWGVCPGATRVWADVRVNPAGA